MYSGGAAQSAPALNGSIKKASVPVSHALHKDGGLKLPWYHLGLLSPHRDSLTVADLALMRLAHTAPRPFSAPCFLPFSTCRALW